MAKFAENNEVDKSTEENQEALQHLGIKIFLVDKTTGEEYKVEDKTATAIRFKERKKKLFIRIKGESGIMVSIPENKLPKFMEIETKQNAIW